MTGENRGPQLAAIDYTFLTITAITIVLRCAVRVFLVRHFGVDDWLMLGAAVTFMLYCSFSLTGVHYGTGQHEAELPDANVAMARMYWWVCYLMYCSTMILSKLSIGFLLLRVAAKKLHTWIIYGAMGVTVLTCMVFFFVTIFQCQPVSYFWMKTQAGSSGTCVPMDVIIALAYLYSACAVITDFTFALLPAWIILGLQLNRRTKIALIPLMAMGCVASSAVVVRFAYLPRFRDPDFLWATTDIAIWSSVEQGLAVAAGSLATLRPLLKLIGYKLGFTTGPSNMGQSGYMNSYGKMGSHTGGLSRRRGSQAAADMLTLNSLHDPTESQPTPEPQPLPLRSKFSTYEVNVKARDTKTAVDMMSFSNAIGHSKTYEVSEEYITEPPATSKSWRRSSPTEAKDNSWAEKGRQYSSDSTEQLRSKGSNDAAFGPSTSSV